MLVVMRRGASQSEIDAVVARIQEFGITPIPLPGAERMAIGTFGATSRAAAEAVESLPGVAEVVPVSRPFKLASREVIPQDTVVRIGSVAVGGDAPLAIMAGPCSVESREQTLQTARAVRAAEMDAITIKAGDMLGIYDGQIVAAADSPDAALLRTLELSPTEGLEIVTIYYGAGSSELAAQAVAAQIRKAHPGLAVEIVEGGQPHYPYVVSLE